MLARWGCGGAIKAAVANSCASPEHIDNRLRREIDVLFKKHVPETVSNERPSGLEIREPIVETLNEAPDLLLVKYPLVLIENEGVRDDRAQAFFFRFMRCVFSAPNFGHVNGPSPVQS